MESFIFISTKRLPLTGLLKENYYLLSIIS